MRSSPFDTTKMRCIQRVRLHQPQQLFGKKEIVRFCSNSISRPLFLSLSFLIILRLKDIPDAICNPSFSCSLGSFALNRKKTPQLNQFKRRSRCKLPAFCLVHFEHDISTLVSIIVFSRFLTPKRIKSNFFLLVRSRKIVFYPESKMNLCPSLQLLVTLAVIVTCSSQTVRSPVDSYANSSLPGDSWQWSANVFDDRPEVRVGPISQGRNMSIREPTVEYSNESTVSSSLSDHFGSDSQNSTVSQPANGDFDPSSNPLNSSSPAHESTADGAHLSGNDDTHEDDVSSVAPVNVTESPIDPRTNQALKQHPTTATEAELSNKFHQDYAHFTTKYSQFHANTEAQFESGPIHRSPPLKGLLPAPRPSLLPPNHRPHSFEPYPNDHASKFPRRPTLNVHSTPNKPMPFDKESNHPLPPLPTPQPIVYQCCKYVFPADLLHDHMIYMIRSSVQQPLVPASVFARPLTGDLPSKSNIKQLSNELDSDEGEREEAPKSGKLQHSGSMNKHDARSEAIIVPPTLRPEVPLNHGTCVPIYQLPAADSWNFRSHRPPYTSSKHFLFNLFRKPFLG
jgi:hypothetical protein